MEAFNHILLEYTPFVVGGVGATVFAAGGALLYKIATRYSAHKMSLGLVKQTCYA